ncbi:uncharacterized protein [Rutidosis leptorrhynchoides]|uniref:uncharacterized protein n=1 Tax=Rutidosis leptorrhynchoides TaxID=125765 RepID=UPI003A997EF6
MGLSTEQDSNNHLELNWTQKMFQSINIESSTPSSTAMKRSLPTQQSDSLNCPRCNSTNTKFCYYNNYNKTQPRHFCKSCKRHWTKGGTLRNVPVGGGRKNKRNKRSNTATTNTSTSTGTSGNHSLGFSDQKYMLTQDKGLLYKPNASEFDQVSWDFNSGFSSANTTMQQLPQQSLGFSIHSSLSSIDGNPNPIPPTSCSPLLNGFKDVTTVTTTMNSSNVSQPWIQAPTQSNLLESNYWTWNDDIDSIVQSDINKSF